jgi:hypothetical protein
MVLAAQAKALVEARYIMAERNPRDLDIVRAKLLKECKRPGFAAVARYVKPIGRGVEGPSIRFAETAIRLMGNIATDSAAIYEDREKRILRVTVSDCETNTPYSSDVTIEKAVERRSIKPGDEVLRQRTNSKGAIVYLIVATEDELLNKQNALVSKAIRTNGLRLIPGDIVEEAMSQVLDTLKKADAEDPDRAKRKLFDAFQSIGVGVAELKQVLGHGAEILQASELAELRGFYAAIRDGQTTWREIVDAKTEEQPGAPTTGSAAVREKIQKKSQDKGLVPVKEIIDDFDPKTGR